MARVWKDLTKKEQSQARRKLRRGSSLNAVSLAHDLEVTTLRVVKSHITRKKNRPYVVPTEEQAARIVSLYGNGGVISMRKLALRYNCRESVIYEIIKEARKEKERAACQAVETTESAEEQDACQSAPESAERTSLSPPIGQLSIKDLLALVSERERVAMRVLTDLRTLKGALVVLLSDSNRFEEVAALQREIEEIENRRAELRKQLSERQKSTYDDDGCLVG